MNSDSPPKPSPTVDEDDMEVDNKNEEVGSDDGIDYVDDIVNPPSPGISNILEHRYELQQIFRDLEVGVPFEMSNGSVNNQNSEGNVQQPESEMESSYDVARDIFNAALERLVDIMEVSLEPQHNSVQNNLDDTPTEMEGSVTTTLSFSCDDYDEMSDVTSNDSSNWKP